MWCTHRGLDLVESQQAGLGLLYIRAVLSYCLLLWSYRNIHKQCGVKRGLGVVESQQAGLGLLYIRFVLSYCLLLWSYRDICLELSSIV